MSQPFTKSGIENLRQFRLHKHNEDAKTERVPGKKRIQVLADSDSDEDAASLCKKAKTNLSVPEKEQRYAAAAKLSPEYDAMDVQDSLVRCDWDVSASVIYLKQNAHPKPVLPHSSKNGMKKQVEMSDDEYDDVGYNGTTQQNVYDSDDSDNETSSAIKTQRSAVLDFLDSATITELLTVKSCSEKKAAAIIQMRPFLGWEDLRKKFECSKVLTGDILNNCQDLINKQNNVADLLQKCKKLVKKLETAVEAGAGITQQPSLLNNSFKLADYQMVGLNWLTVMHNQKMNGILADEMGLGKTIQVIAFLAYLKEKNLVKAPHIIVVPSSTLDNWESELRTWCPSLVVEKYCGNQDERRRMRIRYAKNGFKEFDILLTTYHLISSTPEERKMFRVCKSHYVIFDEAHMLKNMTTARYSNLITINASMRILLTGTPLQNNLLELMSLLCFLMPSFFAKRIADIKSLFVKKPKADEDGTSQFNESQVDRAKRIMKPFVLRRLKKDVLKCLPKKFDYIHKVPMTPTQKEYYKDIVEYYNNAKKVGNGSTDIAGASIMMDMRKAANHPLLLRNFFDDDQCRALAKRLAKTSTFKKQNELHIFEELAVMSDFQIWQLCNKHGLDDVVIPDSLIVDSGKLKHLDTLLPKLKEEGHRILIFSQFTMVLDIIEQYMDIRGYHYFRLDGSTAVEERQDLINNFNADSEVFVFLLSTKAGGVGINLTAADTAIIHDIDFNPYNDKQAEDRCHRMGQTKDVSIYRLISEGTLEEGMLLIAQEKLKLEQGISSENNEAQEQKCITRVLTMALGFKD